MFINQEIISGIEFSVKEFQSRNHYTIRLGPNRYFQSYSSIICMRTSDGKIFLDKNSWDYSRTTGKYRNRWLGENIAETRKKIKLGIYTLVNLNQK